MAKRNFIEVSIDVDDVLGQMSIDEVFDYIDKDLFLDEIGEEYCKEYFGLRD